MPDTPDIWSGRWPEPPARLVSGSLTPVRPIGGRVPRFGVANELDQAQRSAADGGARAATPRPMLAVPVAPTREGVWTRLETWWACREVHPVDLWHRMRCHFGRHQIEGGRQIQLGGRFVRTERCCVWCQHRPR